MGYSINSNGSGKQKLGNQNMENRGHSQKMYQKKQTEEHRVKINGKPESLHGENEYLSKGGVNLLYYKKAQSTHVALYIK